MKRFTETTKWDDPWFRKLKPKYKSFLQYIWDRCDSAGIWVVDMELAVTYVGERVDPHEALKVFDGRVVDAGGGKWLVPGFIPFQYGELTIHCKPHKPILSLVEKHGLVKNGKGYQKGINTHSGRVQEKEKEKEQDKEKEGGTGGDQQSPLLILQAPKPEDDEDSFVDEIYDLYPRKAEPIDAKRAIRRALREHGSLLLREKTSAYAKMVELAYPAKSDRGFIPYPSTWFNAGGFLTDPEDWKATLFKTNHPNPANNDHASVYTLKQQLVEVESAIKSCTEEKHVLGDHYKRYPKPGMEVKVKELRAKERELKERIQKA
jgi:hypothetical protein